ncbi:MAG: hypothetical protein DWQ02_09300 [Bacteroidetes bacterium]|nr:MAG: hypothetical protein DWQ02_09300 [Bacteroidota bacterium]
MNSFTKIASIALLVILAISFNTACNGGSANAEEEEPKIILRSYDEARAYVGQVLDLPIPPDYKAPDYIYSNMTKDQKYEIFGKRYPEFYGLGSTDLLDSVIAYPKLYEVMIIENRALRASVSQ